eukprot:1809559-Ditylum_brightwellii.AAC.1
MDEALQQLSKEAAATENTHIEPRLPTKSEIEQMSYDELVEQLRLLDSDYNEEELNVAQTLLDLNEEPIIGNAKTHQSIPSATRIQKERDDIL